MAHYWSVPKTVYKDVVCFLRAAQQYRSRRDQNHGQSALQGGHYLQEQLFPQSSLSLRSLLFTSKLLQPQHAYTYTYAQTHVVLLFS